MSYNKKGHYGRYSGNAHHSKHHMVNTWEEEDVKRGIEEEHKGHSGHAEALFDDAHDSYNWHPGMDTHAEHGPSRHTSGHLDAYEGVDSKSLHPYDDGAGGIDYEAMARDRAKAKEALTEAAQSHIDSLHPKKKMMMTKNIKPKKMKITKNIKPIKK